MYNDEQNLYHYTYRKDGSESGQQNAGPAGDGAVGTVQSEPQRPIQEMKPVKKNRMGLKVTALALCCALLGGALGGGIVWGVSRATSEATVQVSDRTVSQVSLKTVDGKTEMTDAEVYAANVNSAVSINVTGTIGYNFFGQPVQTASAGSGFVLTTDGYIVTNYHVVENAETVKVTMYNGDEYDARYVGGDEDYDIAVIKVEASDLQAVTLGDSERLNVGDHVLAIGNPLGELTFSMSGGMVSSVNRAINVSGTPFHMIQTDTSINPGNSGGPLLNTSGEVVGIVSAKYSSSNGKIVEGIGFAIPINDVRTMVQDIIDNGHVTSKAYLGGTAGSVNTQMAQGVYLYAVDPDGAAAAAGLQAGDIITQIDGTDIQSMTDLSAARKSYSAGDTAQFTIIRGGQTMQVPVTWGAEPDPSTSAPQSAQDQAGPAYGGYSWYGNPFALMPYYGG